VIMETRVLSIDMHPGVKSDRAQPEGSCALVAPGIADQVTDETTDVLNGDDGVGVVRECVDLRTGVGLLPYGGRVDAERHAGTCHRAADSPGRN
jgi:hypothetical protein